MQELPDLVLGIQKLVGISNSEINKIKIFIGFYNKMYYKKKNHKINLNFILLQNLDYKYNQLIFQ